MSAPIRVHRMTSPLGEWELAVGEPSPALRPYVMGGYTGSVERIVGTLTRLEVPHPGIVCIFNFGDGYRVTDPRQRQHGEWLGSFVAGLYDAYVHVDARGVSQCVQVNLTALGARRLLGIPLQEVTNQSVPMESLLGARFGAMADALHEAPSWEARFAMVEALLMARLRATHDVSPLVARAWLALEASAGRVEIGALARALGCTRKRLGMELRAQVGLPPKVVARIMRFHAVVEQLGARSGRGLSEVAHDCGYYDHAHFDRDFREFAGLSPSAYLALRHPTFGAVLHDD